MPGSCHFVCCCALLAFQFTVSQRMQAENHDQQVHLKVTAADLALLGWMKPEKSSTVEAILKTPEQLPGHCNLPLTEGLTETACQRQVCKVREIIMQALFQQPISRLDSLKKIKAMTTLWTWAGGSAHIQRATDWTSSSSSS